MQTPQTRSRATAMGSPIYTRDPLNPSPLSVEGKNVDADDQTIDSLFQAPADLICPISQTLFRDPVLTAAGQAYEREAIEHHLRDSDTDPLTNSRLASKTLTPVYVLKSRASEYREKTARTCIDIACSQHPRGDPAALLRRAVELVEHDAGYLPHGLTPEVVAYVSSRPSNAYDRLTLEMFASALQENGYRDKAAAVYCHLFCSEHDIADQALMLRRCLSCWQGTEICGRVERHVFEKLVSMLGKRTSISWVVEVADQANLGLDFVADLCEYLLFPPTMPLPKPRSGAINGETLPETLPWDCEKTILVKYARSLTSSLRRRVGEVEEKVERMDFCSGGGGQRILWVDSSVHKLPNASGPLSHLGSVLRHPLLVLPCALVGIIGNPNSASVRVVRVLPLLSLLARQGA